MAFGMRFDATASLRAVIADYQFGVGIFREFIQNSDDARASKQVGSLHTL